MSPNGLKWVKWGLPDIGQKRDALCKRFSQIRSFPDPFWIGPGPPRDGMDPRSQENAVQWIQGVSQVHPNVSKMGEIWGMSQI